MCVNFFLLDENVCAVAVAVVSSTSLRIVCSLRENKAAKETFKRELSLSLSLSLSLLSKRFKKIQD